MIKSVTLENGKTYRVIQRRHSVLIEVLTCRVHHEVNVPIYMEVTGRHVVAKVMAKLVEECHAEALEMNRKFTRDNFEEKYTSTMQYNEFDQSEVDEANGMNDAFDASFHRRAANWGAMDSMSKWIEIDKAHEEALRINETSAQDQDITQTLARRNSLSHKIGLAFAGAALVFSSLVSPVQAEVVPSYPVDASRMSLEGSVAVSIDCSTRKVDVIRESTKSGYFSKQVKKQVANICYGQEGTLDRVYVFKMNKRVGAHDMMVNNTGRWTL